MEATMNNETKAAIEAAVKNALSAAKAADAMTTIFSIGGQPFEINKDLWQTLILGITAKFNADAESSAANARIAEADAEAARTRAAEIHALDVLDRKIRLSADMLDLQIRAKVNDADLSDLNAEMAKI